MLSSVMKCERWIIQHDTSVGQRKIYESPTGFEPMISRTHGGRSIPYENSRRVRSINWVHMWQASCIRPCLAIFWNPGRRAENTANSKHFLTKFELFKLWANTVSRVWYDFSIETKAEEKKGEIKSLKWAWEVCYWSALLTRLPVDWIQFASFFFSLLTILLLWTFMG